MADEGTEFYDPNACEASYGGKEVVGFPEGTMIEVSPEADDYEMKGGTKGAVSTTRIYNRIRTVTIRLMKTSPFHDVLSAARLSSRRSGARGVAAIFDFRDGSGTSIVTGKSVIKSRPTMVFSASGAEVWEWVLWVIIANEADEVVGGNSSFS